MTDPQTDASFVGLVAVDLRGPNRPAHSRGALAEVCGLPVLVRALRVFDRSGVRAVALLVHPADRPAVEEALARHQPVGSTVAWIEDEGATLRPVVDHLELDGGPVLYWPGRVTSGLVPPATLFRPCGGDAAAVALGEDARPAAAVVRIPADRFVEWSDLGVTELAQRVSGPGGDARVVSAPSLLEIRSAGDVSRAEDRLLASLRKDVDGAFARYSRYVSLAITRRIARFRITPNHATLMAGAVGIASGVLAARGGYWWLLAGAAAYLASNVLDGVDGEIARLKLMSSRFGEWLDTVADDLTNLSFTTGTALGSYLTWHQDVYLVLGAVIAAGLIASACLMYWHLITVVHSGDLNAVQWPWRRESGPPHLTSWVERLHVLARRDAFSYGALLAAVVGQAWVSVWLAALGANLPWIGWAGYTLVAGRRPHP